MVISRDNYINKDISLIVNRAIREFDMKEAGFNIIKNEGLFNKDLIDHMEENMTKKERTITIGKIMKKDPDFTKEFIACFSKYRKLFQEANSFEDMDILSIKRDAIFLIDKNPLTRVFEEVEFISKAEYYAYINLNKIEFYYNDRINLLDIKGLNGVDKHPFLKDLKEILRLKGTSNNDIIILSKLKNLRYKYLNLELDLEYYRELNNQHQFKLKDINWDSATLYLDNIDDNILDLVDISYNYINYIIPLIAIMI